MYNLYLLVQFNLVYRAYIVLFSCLSVKHFILVGKHDNVFTNNFQHASFWYRNVITHNLGKNH